MSIAKGLVIEVPERTQAVGTQRFKIPGQIKQGKEAATIVQNILSFSWDGLLRFEQDAGHVRVIAIHDGTELAAVRAERNAEFLLLSKRSQLACYELWAFLKGWVASLGIKSNDEAFSQLRTLKAILNETLLDVRIRVSEAAENSKQTSRFFSAVSAAQSPSSEQRVPPKNDFVPSLVPHGADLSDAAKRFLSRLEEVHSIQPNVAINSTIKISDLAQAASEPAFVVAWLPKILAAWEGLPQFLNANAEKEWERTSRYLRVFADRLNKLRLPLYHCERKVLQKLSSTPIFEDLTIDQLVPFQVEVLRLASKSLSLILDHFARMSPDSRSAFLGSDRTGNDSISKDSMHHWARQLIDVHRSAVWPNSNRSVFMHSAKRGIANEELVLAEFLEDKDATDSECWNFLFRFAKIVVLNTSDSGSLQCLGDADAEAAKDKKQEHLEARKIDPYLAQFLEVVKPAGREFAMLFQMRNRCSHQDDRRARNSWVAVQRFAADILEREYRIDQHNSLPEMRSPCDFRLKPLEANEIKLYLLKRCAEAIDQIKSRGTDASP
ncbi:MAG: hypothetical protein U0892_16780 [Pirellulales bacterium]